MILTEHMIAKILVSKQEKRLIEIIEAVIENSICVIIVMTKVALQSIWFQDNQPCDLVRKVIDTHENVITLVMDEKLSCDQFFSGSSVKVFECCDYVPWQALTKHIKLCCGDSPEDLSTLQAFDDLLAENSSN